jgi:hypothetical protein
VLNDIWLNGKSAPFQNGGDNAVPYQTSYGLVIGDGKRFPMVFDCFPYVSVIDREPSWQQGEDAIVGKMIRKLLSFEGGYLNDATIASMQSIVDGAAHEAEAIGARPEYIRSIGQRLILNGNPMDSW